MPRGDDIFREWEAKVGPRIEYVRSAYRAAAVLQEIAEDTRIIRDHWLEKANHPNPLLAQQAKEKYDAYAAAYDSYQKTLQQVGAQMDEVARELDSLQDERLRLAAMCTSLNTQDLTVEVLQKAYEVIGPDTAIDGALGKATKIIADLNSERLAREELRLLLES